MRKKIFVCLPPLNTLILRSHRTNLDFCRSQTILRLVNKHCLVTKQGKDVTIANRKVLEKEEMRKKILASAMKLFLSEGYDRVSIRKIADAIDYSPATVYLYFKDKTAIFNSLQKIAFDKFFETLTRAVKIKDAKKRLDKIGELYMKFAFDNPEYYDLMFIMSAPIDRTNDECYTDVRGLELLSATIAEVFKNNRTQKVDVEAVTFLLWGFTHGLASLVIRKRLAMFPDKHIKELFSKISKIMDERIFK